MVTEMVEPTFYLVETNLLGWESVDERLEISAQVFAEVFKFSKDPRVLFILFDHRVHIVRLQDVDWKAQNGHCQLHWSIRLSLAQLGSFKSTHDTLGSRILWRATQIICQSTNSVSTVPAWTRRCPYFCSLPPWFRSCYWACWRRLWRQARSLPSRVVVSSMFAMMLWNPSLWSKNQLDKQMEDNLKSCFDQRMDV